MVYLDLLEYHPPRKIRDKGRKQMFFRQQVMGIRPFVMIVVQFPQ